MDWQKLLFGLDPKKAPAQDGRDRLRFFIQDLLRILAVVLILFVVFQVFQGLRADFSLKSAKRSAESGHWQAAFSEAIQSMELDPNLEAARIVVEAAYHLENSAVVRRAPQLFRLKGATLDDRILALSALVDLKHYKVAKTLSDELSSQERQSSEILLQLTRIALDSGDISEAIQLANQGQGERSPEVSLLLAKWYPLSNYEEFYPAFEKEFLEIVGSEDFAFALHGLDLLVSLKEPWRQKGLTEQVIKRFDGLEGLSPIQEMHLEWLKVEIDQQDFDTMLSRLMERYSATHLSSLLKWLAGLDRNEEILKLTNDVETQKDKELLAQRLLALVEAERWDELGKVIEDPPVVIVDPLLFAIQAGVDSSQGDRDLAAISWKKAMRGAQLETEHNWFVQISRIAQKVANRDMEMEALVESITHPKGVFPSTEVLTRLFEWFAQRDDLNGLLEMSKTLVRLRPSDPVLMSHEIYLRALNDRSLSQDAAVLDRLSRIMPNDGVLQRRLAFVHWRLQQYDQSLDVLERLVEAQPQESFNLALLARVLFEMGEEREAREVDRRVDRAQLDPQERAVLRFPAL